MENAVELPTGEDPLAFLHMHPEVPSVAWVFNAPDPSPFPEDADWIVAVSSPGSTVTFEGEPVPASCLPIPRSAFSPDIVIQGRFRVVTLGTNSRTDLFRAGMPSTKEGTRMGEWTISAGCLQRHGHVFF